MRHLDPLRRATLALAMASLIAVGVAAPALAKIWIEARLDAPIAMGTPAGTELEVGVTVTVPEGIPVEPVAGSTVVLELLGPDGDRTRASGELDPAGHAVVRMTVPPGGPRELTIALAEQPGVPFMLAEDPFTFGPVTARTAQVAAPLAPAASLAPARAPAAVDSPDAGLAAWVPAVAIGAAAALALVLVVAVLRGPGRRHAPRGVQGA
jgi:hypothetical protein